MLPRLVILFKIDSIKDAQSLSYYGTRLFLKREAENSIFFFFTDNYSVNLLIELEL